MNAMETKVPGVVRERMLTPEDIAIDISRPVRFVLSLIRTKQIAAVMIGPKTFRIRREVYREFLKQREGVAK